MFMKFEAVAATPLIESPSMVTRRVLLKWKERQPNVAVMIKVARNTMLNTSVFILFASNGFIASYISI